MTTTDKARLHAVASALYPEWFMTGAEEESISNYPGQTAKYRERAYAKAQVAIDAYEASAWQQLETAPRDGTTIFVWTGNEEFPSRWEASWREPTESEYWVSGSDNPDPVEQTFSSEAGWFSDEWGTRKLDGDAYPTLWMPIPKPPAGYRMVKDAKA